MFLLHADLSSKDVACLALDNQGVRNLVYTALLRLLGQGITYNEDGLPRGVPIDKLAAWAPTLSQSPTSDHPAIIKTAARDRDSTPGINYEDGVNRWFASVQKNCPSAVAKLTQEAATRFVQAALQSATDSWANNPMGVIPAAPSSGRHLLAATCAPPRSGNYSTSMHGYQKGMGLGLLGALAGSQKYTALALADVATLAHSPIDATQAAAGILLGAGMRKAGGQGLAANLDKQAINLDMNNKLAAALFNLRDIAPARDTSVRDIMKQYAELPVGKYAVSSQTAPLQISLDFDQADALNRGTAGNAQRAQVVAQLAPKTAQALQMRNKPLMQTGNTWDDSSAQAALASMATAAETSHGLLQGLTCMPRQSIHKLNDYTAVSSPQGYDIRLVGVIGNVDMEEKPATASAELPARLRNKVPITGRVQFQRKAPKNGGKTYPAGVQVRCYDAADNIELCNAITQSGGNFQCYATVTDRINMRVYCQFEALQGVTFPFRTHTTPLGTQPQLDLGMVDLFPDRRGLPGCQMNKCGPAGKDLIVPDCWFGDPCDNHDCCYSECGTSQELCDHEMSELAMSVCRVGKVVHTPFLTPVRPGPSIVPDICFLVGGCNDATVALYKYVLGQLGGDAFASAQQHCLE
jgi:hypothetical protein